MPRTKAAPGRSIAVHSFLGAAVVVVGVGALALWSMSTEIAGAVVAAGAVAVDGGPKRVQHPEGGVVTGILVADEDRVRAGQPLVYLDGTALQANFDLVLAQQRDAYARELRLLAEVAGRSHLTEPPELPPGVAGDEFEKLLATQSELIGARAASLAGQRERLGEQIVQLERKIEGLSSQLAAEESQQLVVASELADQQRLFSEQLVGVGRINELKRIEAQLRGEVGRITASIAETRATITEHRAMLAQLEDDRRIEVLKELQAVRAELIELAQQRVALADRLDRLIVRAPQTGIVHASTVVTVGGVVGGGETLMMVVPALEQATVDVRVSPFDIDKIHPSQEVTLRFTSLDARRTPDLKAEVKSVAPDLTTDQRSGAQYYLARVVIDAAELERLPAGTRLVPGMPAEAFIRTGDRTVLAYLVKPLMDQVERAFRED
jgi:HlyD family secretion protein